MKQLFERIKAGQHSSQIIAVIAVVALLATGVFASPLFGGEQEEYGTERVYVPGEGYMDADDAFDMIEQVFIDIEPLSTTAERNQRRDAWASAVANPHATGGVWQTFWANANFNDAVSITIGTTTIPAGGNAIGTVFSCSRGFGWRVIASYNNSLLIISEHATMSEAAGWSDQRTTLTTWAAAHLAPELRALMRTPVNGTGNTLSRPVTASTANTSVMNLSSDEFRQYFGSWDGAAGTIGGLHSPGAFFHDQNGVPRNWWLRGTGVVGRNGFVFSHTTPPSGNIFVRPALWIGI